MSTDGKDDLAVMFPREFHVTVNGENVHLHEYGWVEEQELRQHSQPFINDLMVLFSGTDATMENVDALVSKHIKAIQTMIAVSASKSVDWVRGLNKTDGDAVYRAWWSANGPFFVSCATESLRSELMEKARAGLMLLQRSSQTTTPRSELQNTPTGK